MALTLDGTAQMPSFGGTTGTGTGLAAGAGVIGGLLLGGLLGNNGTGLFGGNSNSAGNAEYASLQNQLQTMQGQIGAQSMHSEINELENSLNSANIANLQGISNNALIYQQGNANLATALATGNFTTLTSINGLGRDVTASQNQAALQQLNSFNNLTTTTLQGFNSSAMQIQNSTNQIIAQGTANAAAVAAGFCDVSKQMAQCCCEMKGAIAAEGSATRALINDLNVQNLRDQLAAANNKVSNNDQNQYLITTILAHLRPVTTSVVS